MSISNQCISCEHYLGVGKCEAFPKGIPEEIISGKVSHTKPYEGDRGIQYKEIPGILKDYSKEK